MQLQEMYEHAKLSKHDRNANKYNHSYTVPEKSKLNVSGTSALLHAAHYIDLNPSNGSKAGKRLIPVNTHFDFFSFWSSALSSSSVMPNPNSSLARFLVSLTALTKNAWKFLYETENCGWLISNALAIAKCRPIRKRRVSEMGKS